MFLLKPFISLIEKLRFTYKLLFLALLFSIPLAISIHENIKIMSSQLSFIEKESDGIDYLPQVLTVLKETQVYRGLTRLSQAGNQEAAGKLAAQEKKINDAIAVVDDQIATQKDQFQLQVRWDERKASWVDAKKNATVRSLDENFKTLSALIDSYLGLMGEIANDTNIALDPETDTYFVLAAAYTQAPLMMEFAGKSRAMGAAAISANKLNMETRIDIASLIAKSIEFGNQAKSGLDLAFKYNPELQKKIVKKSEAMLASNANYSEVANTKLIYADVPSISAADYFDSGTKAVTASFEFAIESFAACKEILGERHQAAEKKLSFTYMAATTTFVAILILFGALWISIVSNLRMAVNAAESIRRGNLDVDISSTASDEAGELLRSMQGMVRVIKRFNTAQLDLAAEHVRGNIDKQMDASEFQGAYADMATATNKLTQELVAMNAQALHLMDEYANNHFEKSMPELPGKKAEITRIVNGARAVMEAASRSARENLRVRNALDNVKSNVLIVNNDNKIIYANKAILALLAQSSAGVNAEKIIGSDVGLLDDTSSKNLRGLMSPIQYQFTLGGRHIAAAASPVFDEEQQRIGCVLEWNDRTSELTAEAEIAAIVQAAATGDFTQRIDEAGKEGFFLQTAQGLNEVLELSNKGLTAISEMLKALADGDLSYRIEEDFNGVFAQLKSDGNATAEKLTSIMHQVREAADSVNAAATEIATGNQNLSARTEQQAANIEETASSMEELSSIVKNNSENANHADKLAKDTQTIALKGGELVTNVVATMSGISQSSEKIADIIGVIDGIAFQTNILALNAAVEAARAGDQGRGFAVVASEVRNLAQRSANAAKEIKSLIADSVNRVKSGTVLVEEAGHTMEEIVASVKRVANIMDDISTASSEQANGIEGVTAAVNQMDENTQQNAALVEEASAAAETMRDQSAQLVDIVMQFKFDGATKKQAVLSAPVRATKTLSAPKKLVAQQQDEWESF